MAAILPGFTAAVESFTCRWGSVHESFSSAYIRRMSTKHVNTASDVVRFRASVKLECAHCGAARTLDGMELVRMCGAGSLGDAQRRLKCSRCGKKGPRLIVLPPV
jgi:hypothetical protein